MVRAPPPMRLGLIRHFPVKLPLPRSWEWLTAEELERWGTAYDASDVETFPLDLGAVPWARCLSSDLKRARITAEAAQAAPVEPLPLLREAEILRFGTGSLRLPALAWRWTLRLAWLTGHRCQRAARDAFMVRVRAVADLLDEAQEDTLVVSHAGMMMFLRKELLKRGFRGPRFGIAKNAKLYVFER